MYTLKRIPLEELPQPFRELQIAKTIIELCDAHANLYAVVQVSGGTVVRLITTGAARRDKWDKLPLP